MIQKGAKKGGWGEMKGRKKKRKKRERKEKKERERDREINKANQWFNFRYSASTQTDLCYD
jgi:hypothetical protein